jgi:LIVCS family branched-chain amino acid:cation transporter
VSLAYLGAASVEAIGQAANGGILLSQVANIYYATFGNVILGLAILFACLTTSIGLVSSCAAFFEKMFPRLGYKKLVIILSGFSLIVSNIGLTQLIALSVPVLVTIYPLVIVLIGLTFLEKLFDGRTEVYRWSMAFTGIVSVIDGLKAANIPLGAVNKLCSAYLPFFDSNMGWLLPALAGAILGYLISLFAADTAAGDAETVN